MENERNNKGKNYAVADIHGMYGSYDEIMRKLSPRDHLYIIGDVIDRGQYGIRILQDIMRRQADPQNNPDITFFVGNHEIQFLNSVVLMLNNKIKGSSLENLSILRKLERSRKTKERLGEKVDDELLESIQKYSELCEEAGITGQIKGYLETWLYLNHGEKTMQDFLKLTNEQKRDIYNFLVNSYVMMPQEINGKDYLFVHSVPSRNIDVIRKMKEERKGYKLYEVKPEEYCFVLQARDERTSLKNETEAIEAYKQCKRQGFTTICGHTYNENGKIVRNEDRGYIRIDAGCGQNIKLVLYCIDDDREEYFEPREDIGFGVGFNNSDSDEAR